MLVEEIFMQQMGRALIATGRERTIEHILYTLTHPEAYLMLETDPRLSEPARQGLRLHREETVTAGGTLTWIRTVALVRLYLTHPQFQAKTDAFWSIVDATYYAALGAEWPSNAVQP